MPTRNIISPDFSDVEKWLAAGQPLDKSFVIKRVSETGVDSKQALFAKDMLSSLIVGFAEMYREQLHASGINISLVALPDALQRGIWVEKIGDYEIGFDVKGSLAEGFFLVATAVIKLESKKCQPET